MHLIKSIFTAFFVLLLCSGMEAQQTSKSKTKEKLYEKTGENKNVKVRNATSINSAGDEFSPSFYREGIVFAGSKGKHGPKGSNAKVFTDLYYSPLDPNFEPLGYSRFSLEMNSRKNEGAATFSRDWKYMYFTQNNIIDGVEKVGRDGKLHLKIFQAKRGSVDWTNKVELPFNSDQYSCMHPTLAADDKTLYFASDMPGGLGGFDLYKAVVVNGIWSNPVNLGPSINTEKNEVFPFIFPSGDLYFSSGGHNSLGGYDIFRIQTSKDKDKNVVNLGQPFNSEKDDFGFILNDDGTKGFFTSNRPGGFGNDDIYSFTVDSKVYGMAAIESKQKTIMVLDANDQPLQGAEIRVLTMGDGAFQSASQERYRTRFERIDPNSNELIMRLVKMEAEELGQPDAFTNAAGEARFDFQAYRDYLIIANNESLTSETVYRIKEDEALEQITIKLSIPKKKVLHGKLLNPAGYSLGNAKLRFTNYTSSMQDHSTTDEQGNFAVSLEKGEYSLRISKEGFKDEYMYVEFDPNDSDFREFRLSNNSKPADKLPITDVLKPGYVMTIDKIEYELNSDRLGRTSQLILQQVIDLMVENPQMEIDIFSHTDAQGASPDNLRLSQRRADNAKTYITEMNKKISPSRINALGKGEAELKNHCKDGVRCDPADHAVNRRTEFVIRKM